MFSISIRFDLRFKKFRENIVEDHFKNFWNIQFLRELYALGVIISMDVFWENRELPKRLPFCEIVPLRRINFLKHDAKRQLA